jgi:hypothetical protein
MVDKILGRIADGLFSHAPLAVIVIGVIVVVIGAAGGLPVGNPPLQIADPAWRLGLGIMGGILAIAGLLLQFREPSRKPQAFSPDKDASHLDKDSASTSHRAVSAADFKAFYEATITNVSPPNLLFLAAAEFFTFPSTHGEQVAHLNLAWQHDQNEWEKRSSSMEELGLLERNGSSEVTCTDLGKAIVYLALRDQRFAEVVNAMKSNQDMAKKWGI